MQITVAVVTKHFMELNTRLDSAHHPTMGGGYIQPYYGGGISQVWGGHTAQVWGGHQPSMGGCSAVKYMTLVHRGRLWGGFYQFISMGGFINQFVMGGAKSDRSMGGGHQPTMGEGQSANCIVRDSVRYLFSQRSQCSQEVQIHRITTSRMTYVLTKCCKQNGRTSKRIVMQC